MINNIEKYYKVLTETWRFIRKYAESMEDTDKWWDGMITEASDLTKRYNCERFAMDVIEAALEEMERKAKDENNKAQRSPMVY